jgi:hypothetical protein
MIFGSSTFGQGSFGSSIITNVESVKLPNHIVISRSVGTSITIEMTTTKSVKISHAPDNNINIKTS